MIPELDGGIRERIEHIVVVMMENRSFDHMLGYLGMPAWRDTLKGPVEGLGEDGVTVAWDGTRHQSYPLGSSTWPAQAGDPPHDGESVAWQVADSDRFEAGYRKKHPQRDSSVVMGYLTPDELPVYDFLAREFCVCDNWFCSVAGATWPNRMFAVAGSAGGETDIPATALEGLWGNRRTMLHALHDKEVSWRWYSSDPSLLRVFSRDFRFDDDKDHFAYFDEWTEHQERNFLSDARDGTLPEVAWIDPNFFLPGDTEDELTANDDHPPHDVRLGQTFVHKVYEALRSNAAQWEKTLLLITYDEHGGFYDHVKAPPPLGPRVPGFVVSPWVKRGVPCHTELEHTSIIKTVLRRFADEAEIEKLGPRVYFAHDVWDMVSTEARSTSSLEAVPSLEPRELKGSASTLQRVIEVAEGFWGELTELQQDLLDVFAKLRGGDLPPELVAARRRARREPETPAGARMPDRQP